MMSPRSPSSRKRRFQPIGEGPDAGLGLGCQAIAFEGLQPAHEQRLVEIGAKLAGVGPQVEKPRWDFLDQDAVEPREALGRHLGLQLLSQFKVGLRAKLQGDALLGADAHPVGDVVLGDDEVFAGFFLAADQHMAVRVAGVEVVDRHPIEPRAEILLHLAASHRG